MADRVIQRNDIAARWQSVNPILATGEIGIEIDGAKGYKIGDGKTRWNDLPYPANPTNVVQELGNNENAVPSQKLVTEKLSELGSQVIYDVSANNDGATFASLSALLSNENLSTLIPTAVRCGGMSIRFVQSSDNKTVQYMLTSNVFSAIASNWIRVNDLLKIVDLKNPIEYINNYWNIQPGDTQRVFTVIPLTEEKYGYLRISGVSELKSITFNDSNWSPVAVYQNISENEIVDIVIPKNAPNLAINVNEAVTETTSVYIEICYDSTESRIRKLENDFTNSLIKTAQTLSASEAQQVYNNLLLKDETPTNIISMSTWNTGSLTNFTFDLDSELEEGSIIKLNIIGVVPNKIALKDVSGNKLLDTLTGYCQVPQGTKKITIYLASTTETPGSVGLYIWQYGSAIIANYLLNERIPKIEENEIQLTNDIKQVNNKVTALNTKLADIKGEESVTLDLTSLILQRGTINNTNGEIIEHNFRLVSSLIPIRELQTLYSICNITDNNNFYGAGIFFYNVNRYEETNINYIGYYYWGNSLSTKNLYHIVPKGANAVRITFQRKISGTEVQINTSDITATNYTFQSIFTDNFEYCNTELKSIGLNEDFKLNDYTDFILGNNSKTSQSIYGCTSIKPILVCGGEKYAILCNMNNQLYSYRIRFYSDINGDIINTITLGVQTSAGISGHYYSVVDVPVNAQYMRVTLLGGFDTTTFSVADAIEANTHIINITNNKIVYGEKVVSYTSSSDRYAQGFVIQNGYGFLAFSDGTIDIYNVSNWEKIQSKVVVPKPESIAETAHLNSINFVEQKYDNSDEFNILMCQPNRINELLFCLRVIKNNNTFSFSLINEFNVPTLDDTIYVAAQTFIDTTDKLALQSLNKKVKTDNYNGGFGEMEFRKYVFTGDIVGTPSFIEEEDCRFSFPRIYPPQGGKIINGRLYLVFGTDKKSSYIIGFDLNGKKSVDVINLRLKSFGINITIEPQAFDTYKDGIAVATTHGIFVLHL